MSSPDPRALAAYLKLGLDLIPAAAAVGVPRGVEAPADVREGSADDRAMMAEVAVAVRGAAHGGDVDALLAVGHELLVHPGRGFVTYGGGVVGVLAAADEDAATDLLRAVMAAVGRRELRVPWLAARTSRATPARSTPGRRRSARAAPRSAAAAA